MRDFQETLARKKKEHGEKFDPQDLAVQFIPYFENEKRIEVDFGYEKKRGTVGITTGWKPGFLLMLTKRSMGSSYTLRSTDKIVRIIR